MAAAALLYSCNGLEPTEEEIRKEKSPIDSTIYIGIGKSGRDTTLYFPECIRDAGGVHVFFEDYADSDYLAAGYVTRVDGLIIPGSTDNDKDGRTACDKRLIQAALDQGKPVFGICFGHQKVNESRKGNTYATTVQLPGTTIKHMNSNPHAHTISIEPGSKLATLIGATSATVNSTHNYCVAELGFMLKVTARASDGCVESIESTLPGQYLFGVQFHPERLYAVERETVWLELFKDLVNAAREYKFKEN